MSDTSVREGELSTLNYWIARLKRPLCQHDYHVVGHADDRYLGFCEVVHCRHCGARERVRLAEREAASA